MQVGGQQPQQFLIFYKTLEIIVRQLLILEFLPRAALHVPLLILRLQEQLLLLVPVVQVVS